jgi:hypothetical protein
MSEIRTEGPLLFYRGRCTAIEPGDLEAYLTATTEDTSP